MLRGNVLFVVGAGASQELGLPVGAKLQEKISEMLDLRQTADRRFGDERIWTTLWHYFPNEIEEYKREAWAIRDGMKLSTSIDAFLDVDPTNEKIQVLGKIAIALAITAEEARSALFVDPHRGRDELDLDRVAGSWLPRLFRLIQNGQRADAVDRFFEHASFVVFNYDRCLEQFFYYALRQFYRLDKERAASIVDGANIFHPYGTTGGLRWSKRDQVRLGFGESPDDPLKASQGLRTYTEKYEDPALRDRLRVAVSSADVIIFSRLRLSPAKHGVSTTSSTNSPARSLWDGVGDFVVQSRGGSCRPPGTPSTRQTNARSNHGVLQYARYLQSSHSDRMMRRLAVVALLALGACGKRGAEVVATPPTAVKQGPLAMPLTIDEVMVGPVDFAADGIWRPAAKEKLTEQEWLLVEQDAVSLIASATLITTAGIGADDPAWVEAADWRDWSAQMQEQAEAARDAARERNKYKLDIASDKLIEICAACHTKYRSDVPRGPDRFPFYPKRPEVEG